MKARLATLLCLAALGASAPASRAPGAAAAPAGPLVLVGRVEGPIHPAASAYLRRLLASARDENARLVVLELSTPGGLLTSTREMATAILTSPVPVATYVAPSGASSASAGFFLLLAGDVAAMAPGTNTGAAHPVGGEGQDLPKTMSSKVEQDARAFIRTLARQHGRNPEKAETAVQSSVSFTETEAKEAGLIEVIARDLPDLLRQLDGRSVSPVSGDRRAVVLHLAGARVENREMSSIQKLLGVVSHPNIAYVLFLAGLVGLYFELSSPGAILPGIVGGIALLLALYAFSVLPVNLAGIALIGFAVLLFVAEVKVTSHGLLAVGGAVALVAGSALLFSGSGDAAGYRVDLSVILPGVALTLAVVAFLSWRTVRLRRLPVRTGREGLVGQAARVVKPFFGEDGRGTVLVHGEYWTASGAPGALPGENVRVVGLDGFTLQVERRIE
ncbi:MAG: nodulation protein NfeD [Acidobacteriota bacterium]|nr:nodulation protein NfeD [Acidobacteriota bacterium]